MFSSYFNRSGRPPSHAVRVFEIGSKFIETPILILLFAPLAAIFAATFMFPPAELSRIAMIASEYHGWLVALLVLLGTSSLAGFMLMSAGLEAIDEAEMNTGQEPGHDE